MLPTIRLTLNLETHPWTELLDLRKEGKVITAMGSDAGELWIGVLPAGMRSGEPSVAIGLTLPDGSVIVTETSMKLFLASADAMRTMYGK